jgi:hypothetical protein
MTDERIPWRVGTPGVVRTAGHDPCLAGVERRLAD